MQAFRRLRSIFAHNFVPKTLLYFLKMTVENMLAAREIKKEKGIALKENAAAPLAANIKMEKGVSVKREPVFGPGGLLRIKREFMGMAPMMNIKREMIKGEPLDVKPQVELFFTQLNFQLKCFKSFIFHSRSPLCIRPPPCTGPWALRRRLSPARARKIA